MVESRRLIILRSLFSSTVFTSYKLCNVSNSDLSSTVHFCDDTVAHLRRRSVGLFDSASTSTAPACKCARQAGRQAADDAGMKRSIIST